MMQIDKRYQKRRRKSKVFEQTAVLRQELKGREVLRGMVEIAAYLCISIGAANSYIKLYGMPAFRIGSHKSRNPSSGDERGEWMTTKSLINQWIAVEHYKYLDRNGFIDDEEETEEPSGQEESNAPAKRAVG